MTRRSWTAVALVAATYGYFLIFAEFAFIELARPVTGDGTVLRGVMGALAFGGVSGGVLAARRGGGLDRWLAACALAALVAVPAMDLGVAGAALAAMATGLALGGATVRLATGLRGLAGSRRLGLATGLGTGAAYAACNIPFIFDATPAMQAVLAAAGSALAAGLARGQSARELPEADERFSPRLVAPWVVVFLALVWMDSAAFYIIQHTAELKAATWAGDTTLLVNAAVHFGTAALAGVALDRGRAPGVVACAGLALAGACQWLETSGAGLAYVAGVSLYSAALVYVPARMASARVAAVVFSIAGWGGSALGIGMAQDLRGIPEWFGPAAIVVLMAGLIWRYRAGGGMVFVVAMAAVAGGTSRVEAADEAAAVMRGRDVYIAEGCIHCHSQYVRPGTDDVVRWGPARDLAEILAERPPLPGNRRQGPDLLNVGNRRSPEWNRLHLIAPRDFSPGSRMPSYARLFVAGETRGEDLVAYLASRGAGTEAARAAQVSAWVPTSAAAAVETRDGSAGADFAQLCASCHGASGRGDGLVAGRLAGRPADLTRAEMDRDEVRLARIIKFGRPGTAMAGRESLDDARVVSLARYVARLQFTRLER